MADTRDCEQCGTVFTPRREHARFCSARCRVAWNRQNASDLPAEAGTLDWSIAAMRETTDRLLRASGWHQPHGFALISEAVWWVTMVDAAFVRYQPDTYHNVLASHGATERRVIERTFGGLRFVRNRMGYYEDHADFIHPLEGHTGPLAAWTWRQVPEPGLASLPARGQEWEMTRFRAYQAQLAGHTVGDTFGRAAAFLQLAADGSPAATRTLGR